ncbi:hypothetical protein ACQKMI_03190 [Lysinibacillus sp. NPDC097214]|uniref:hypothetical protein n=1 Tax=Lysinibacillus sp. NPDC097214 TaxID=3390584 RepID=UPI003D06EAE1
MNAQKLLIPLFLFFLLAGCGLETKTLPEFYEDELEDVTKIKIIDGSTGYKKVINDKNIIDHFLSEIKDIQFIPEENQDDKSGFTYSIAFYRDEEITFSFSLNEVNGHYYYTEPDIHSIIDDFYKNLKVEEE